MNEYHADIGALRLLQILLCLIAALLCAAAGLFLSRWPLIMWITAGVFAGTAVLTGFVCLPLFFRKLRFSVTSSQITVRAGILFIREQSVRLDRVQFVQILSGPFGGLLGLNFVVLHVYGGQLILPFLSRKDRLEITGLLQQRGVFHAP